jgi:hypothetical protein
MSETWLFTTALVAVLMLSTVTSAQDLKKLDTGSRRAQLGDASLLFVPSHSDADASARFVARARKYTLYLENQEADVVLHHEPEPRGRVARGKVIVVQAYADALRMKFVDANPPTQIAPLESEGAGDVSFHKAAKSCSGVIYRGIYPGTDVVFRGSQEEIAFELELSPDADAWGILLEVNGATKIQLDGRGNAVVHAGEASLVLARPTFFLMRDGARRRLAGHFQIEPHNRLRFVPDMALQSRPSVID